MTDGPDTIFAPGAAMPQGARAPFAGGAREAVWAAWIDAIERERAERRLFLWLPVAAGAGVVLYMTADRDPSIPFVAVAALVFAAAAFLVRARPLAFGVFIALFAAAAGILSGAWRSARVAGPSIDRIHIATLEGFVESIDFRRVGARFVLRVAKADGFEPEAAPHRVRLTIRRTPPFDAGTYVSLKARLVPPAHAAQPGGYDFARDAWFAELGAVGNVLGRVELLSPPAPPGLGLRVTTAVDRARNALARRVDAIIGGDAGAIGAAMVTGKRDLLSEEAKALIREAGIFHIITIAGVQMTLVAAIFFVGLRRALALSPTLALRYPIKKWAAGAAMAGAFGYDVLTGSRIGTERALIMTLIMLGAVLCDRQALTMRNLALAALVVILVEPEAIMGASFQLSFAAVAALVAVTEARTAARARAASTDLPDMPVRETGRARSRLDALMALTRHGPAATLFATLCATSATAAFMAFDFHELSPYVLLGNPLTLAIIEIFAVPGALLGALLYPIGLDALVWHYLGFGIGIVLAIARFIGGLPGATLHLPAFAPWSLAFFALAVLSAVLWRSLLLRATAIPLAAIGLCGALVGAPFDLAIAPTGEAMALRAPDGQLVVYGHRPSSFAAEQWLRADADGRIARTAIATRGCDKLGCVGYLGDGRAVSLVLDKGAFAEDCNRASILVTSLYAPTGCAAETIFDRAKLTETGAVAIRRVGNDLAIDTARALDEDRPWSRAPKRRWSRAPSPRTPAPDASTNEAGSAADGL